MMFYLALGKLRFSLGIFLLLLISQTANAVPKVTDWTLPYLHTQKNLLKIDALLGSEINEPIIEDDQSELGVKGTSKVMTFGYGFSPIDPIRELCLLEVKKRHLEKEGVRPRILDVGAGRGHMAWKLILAGANYHGIEGQMATLPFLHERLEQTQPFLKEGETLASVSRVSSMNLLDFKAKEAIPAPFEVVWMGDLIHFLSPLQLEQSLDDLRSMMNPGGEVFASADSPSLLYLTQDTSIKWVKKEMLVDQFLENLSRGEEFPGSIIVNYSLLGVLTFDSSQRVQEHERKMYQIESVVSTASLGIEGHTFLPGETYLGFVGESPKTLTESFRSQKTIETGGKFKLNYVSKQKIVFHVFDAQTLVRVFEKHGFKVLDVFYFDNELKRIEADKVGPKELTEQFFKVAIRAHRL